MSFRKSILSLAESELPHVIVPTRFGEVKVMQPLAERVDEFVRHFGDKWETISRTHGALIALSCYDPESGLPMFGPGDVAALGKLPAGFYGPIAAAISNMPGALSLDPIPPETATGSASVSDSGKASATSANG